MLTFELPVELYSEITKHLTIEKLLYYASESLKEPTPDILIIDTPIEGMEKEIFYNAVKDTIRKNVVLLEKKGVYLVGDSMDAPHEVLAKTLKHHKPLTRTKLEYFSDFHKVREAQVMKSVENDLPKDKEVTEINLVGRDLCFIPEALIKRLLEYPKLKKLNLSHNRLFSLPRTFGLLRTVTELDLSNNHFSTQPICLGKLVNLEFLLLYNNQLRALNNNIGELILLRTLFISCNQLHTLPDSLGRLKYLEMLSVSSNKLTSLPATLGKCLALNSLLLSINQLSTLPVSLAQLTALSRLDISANPFKTPFPISLAPVLKKCLDWFTRSEYHHLLPQEASSSALAGSHSALATTHTPLFTPSFSSAAISPLASSSAIPMATVGHVPTAPVKREHKCNK